MSKANVLMRMYYKTGDAYPDEVHGEVEKLLKTSSEMNEVYAQPFSTLTEEFAMVFANNNALIKHDREGLDRAVELAKKIETMVGEDIDLIDIVLCPYAEMLLEFKDYDKSIDILHEAVSLCEKYPDSLPYLRKKDEVLEHIKDVEVIKDNK